MSLQIKVNGETLNYESPLAVDGLLNQLGYKNEFVAVAINRSCIPKSQYSQKKIEDGDDIEILAPMAGG